MIHNILTIAGTDPTGGAGIQADLKTFSALGTYGMSVVTAVVAQNTCGVRGFEALLPEFVVQQIDAVFDDVRVDAVKIGMLANAGIAGAVAESLKHWQPKVIILDPVMVAKSGDKLLDDETVEIIRRQFLPMATLVTPNLPEALVLAGKTEQPTNLTEMASLVEALNALGSQRVLLKGGHLQGNICIDILGRDQQYATENQIFEAPRVVTTNDHGTGCTLSAAIAALTPRLGLDAAVKEAKDYLTGALSAAHQLSVGHGHGPVHHFYRLWS